MAEQVCSICGKKDCTADLHTDDSVRICNTCQVKSDVYLNQNGDTSCVCVLCGEILDEYNSKYGVIR